MDIILLCNISFSKNNIADSEFTTSSKLSIFVGKIPILYYRELEDNIKRFLS